MRTLCLLMLSVSAMAQAPRGWAEFTREFDRLTDRDKIVGAGVVVVRAGSIAAHHEHGLADREQGTRISERTLFHYGSITKTLTAIAIMQLRDRGKLTLDDPVVRYVPELRQVHDAFGPIERVTIRMLLSHSAGFQNPTWPYAQGKPWEPFEPTAWTQLTAMMPYQELLFEPGSRFSYSNPAFIYLARIIEQLTGDPWASYIQKNIFAPLGLSRSYFGVTPYYMAEDRSHNYTLVRDAAGNEVARDNGADFDPGITMPNGGWNAPLADLATYLAFLTNAHPAPRYNTVLTRASLEEMWMPRYDTDAKGERMGLSFFVLQRGSSTFIGHTGSQAGFLAFLYWNRQNGTGVVAAFNTAAQTAGPGEPSAFKLIREAALRLIE